METVVDRFSAGRHGWAHRVIYAWTEGHSYVHTIASEAFYELWIGLPFGILAAALWARPKVRQPAVVVLICGSWAAAHWTALYLSAQRGSYVAMCSAGFIGALAVTISLSVACDRVRSARCLIGSPLAGAIAAIPFALAFSSGTTNSVEGLVVDPWRLVLPFAVWQLVVGMWIYACVKAQAGTRFGIKPVADSDRGDSAHLRAR